MSAAATGKGCALGCGGAPCACNGGRGGIGAAPVIASQQLPFDPGGALNTFGPLLSSFLPGGNVAVSALQTAAGITTPVSAEDEAALAKLIQNWTALNAAPPNISPAVLRDIGAQRAQYSDFLRAWNAAQRNPAQLHQLLAASERLLDAMHAAQDMASHVPIRYQKVKANPWPYVIAGGALVVVGGAVAFIAGK